jgi:hypothetical protein
MLSSILLIVFTVSLTFSQQNDTIIRQMHPLSSFFFDEIVVDGAFDIFLSQLSGFSVPTVEFETTVTAHKQIIVEVLDHHILSIHIKRPLIVHKNINGYIRFNSPLKRYTIKGTGNTVTDDNGISNTGDEKFVLDNRGTANVAMQLNVNELEVYLSGTGNTRLWGSVREQATIETKGVGDVNAMNLLTKQVKVNSAGVSTVRVAATDDAEIEVTGVSTVYYRLPIGKKPSKEASTGLGQIVPVS